MTDDFDNKYMSNEHIGKQLIAPTHTTNTLNFSN